VAGSERGLWCLRDASAAAWKLGTELNIDVGATGNLTEKDLDNVSAGAIYIKYGGLDGD
jgi:hypothetical protein